MYLQTSLETMFSALVQAALPQHTQEDQGLYIRLDIRNDENKSVDVYMIVQRPTNYTKVFGAIGHDWTAPIPSEFKLYSDHSSCWRQDGIRFIRPACEVLGNTASIYYIETRLVYDLELSRNEDRSDVNRWIVKSYKTHDSNR